MGNFMNLFLVDMFFFKNPIMYSYNKASLFLGMDLSLGLLATCFSGLLKEPDDGRIA